MDDGRAQLRQPCVFASGARGSRLRVRPTLTKLALELRDDALIGQIRLLRKEAIWGDGKAQAEVTMTANGHHHSGQDMKGGFCSVEDNVFDAPRPDCASSSIVHESRQIWLSQIALLFGGSVAASPVLPPILRAFAGKVPRVLRS